MRVSHFAKIQAIVPPEDYMSNKTGLLKTIGMAQNLNIDDNFGTRAENTIGTPLPVLAPGYQVTNIRMEKATVDGSDFRNIGGFNPLWAHVGETYQQGNLVNIAQAGSVTGIDDAEMYPFMFVLAVKNRVADSYQRSNISVNNNPAPDNSPKARSNSFGMYVCVLQSASISMTSQQAIIMDQVNALARPLAGTWFTDAIKNAYDSNGDARNGMLDVVHSVLYGYRS